MLDKAKPETLDQIQDLDPYWMPFTHNQRFKKNPKLYAEAKGCYYTTTDGQRLFDALSGLWCCNVGHSHPRIVEAVQQQVAKLDYSTAFQIGHPEAFRLAARLADLAPENLNHVFYTNSGSEAVDTALKAAIAYHRIRGQGERTRLIGREKGYHGVGFGGMSVGGIVPNRKMFASVMLPGVDHLPHTHSLEHMAFSHGQPTWGAHLADELERLVALHDASTIAALIVEPMQGSAGVIVPPVGYLERLREICTKHGILLIFDEVICGFGRLGSNFGAQRFNVQPDIMTFAKGVTNGVVPMGGIIVKDSIYDTFMSGPENLIEFFHGYTYSGHPLAVAAAHATLDVYQDEDLFARSQALEPVLEDAVHSLKDHPNVIDVRNIGLAAAVELKPVEGSPGQRGAQVFENGFKHGAALRVTADTIAIAPPLISEEREIAELIDILGKSIVEAA